MGLADNLNSLSTAREQSRRRRSQVMETLLSLAEERTKAEATGTSLPLNAVSGAPGGHQDHATPAIQTDRAGNKGGFNPEFNNALNRLLKDYGGKVKVNSGYRSPERQAILWQQALKKYGNAAAARKWVAPPGKSNHGRGLAADLGYSDAATRRLIHANAAKYGLAFPLSNEPWHIELARARK